MSLKICYALFCDVCEASVSPPEYYNLCVVMNMTLPAPRIETTQFIGGHILCSECSRGPVEAFWKRATEVKEKQG